MLKRLVHALNLVEPESVPLAVLGEREEKPGEKEEKAEKT